MAKSICSAPDCERPVLAKGLCRMHYQRMAVHGSLTLPTRQDHFWRQVDKTEGCWIWMGAVSRNGYGQFHLMGPDGRRNRLPHRLAYEWLVGTIPEGLTIDHLCGNRRCVRPDHLEAVTMQVNVLRNESVIADKARQTACRLGHPLVGANLLLTRDAAGRVHRRCRTCVNRRKREAYHRSRALI